MIPDAEAYDTAMIFNVRRYACKGEGVCADEENDWDGDAASFRSRSGVLSVVVSEKTPFEGVMGIGEAEDEEPSSGDIDCACARICRYTDHSMIWVYA